MIKYQPFQTQQYVIMDNGLMIKPISSFFYVYQGEIKLNLNL